MHLKFDAVADITQRRRARSSMSTDNKTIVRRWFNVVWNKGRESAVDEMLDPDGVLYGLGMPMRGPSEFKPFHAAYRLAFPDITIRIDEMVSSPCRAVATRESTER